MNFLLHVYIHSILLSAPLKLGFVDLLSLSFEVHKYFAMEFTPRKTDCKHLKYVQGVVVFDSSEVFASIVSLLFSLHIVIMLFICIYKY